MTFDVSKYKNVGIGVVLLLVVGTLVFFKYSGYDLSNTVTNSGTVVSTTTGNANTSSTTPSTSVDTAFDITLPPEPVNGTVKGVVELGASGFNSFVFISDSKGSYRVTSKEFGDSLAYEGLTNTDEVKAVLKKYLAKMLNKGVSSDNLHFVVSSGALKETKTSTIAKGLRDAGYVVNEVTPEQEGRYAFIAAMNPAYKDKAFVVDVGSGNTKISWYDGGTIKTVEASGAKYFQMGLSDADVYTEITSKMSRVPQQNRSLCFIIGGVPNTLAKTTNNGKNSGYIRLSPLDSYVAGDDKKVASGINILKAIQASGVSTFVFDDNANFTIGNIISFNK
jgi:hypothetical protein